MTRSFFILCLMVAGLAGCKSKKIAGDGEGKTLKMKPIEAKAHIGQVSEKSDAVTIRSARIKGNVLILEVSYGGGCQDHDFQLIGNEMISKSMPPIRGVRLVHTAHEDMCKAMVVRTLEFDISDLAYKQEKGSEIKLKIDGLDEMLLYTFE